MDKSLIITEFLPGSEYTIDCLSDQNKLLVCEGRQRLRIRNGISVNSKIVEDPRFLEIAEKICEKLDIIGAWFFEVKENSDGELILLEIAPRIAGTMALNRARGINFVALSLLIHEGVGVKPMLNPYDLVIDRALVNKIGRAHV